MQAEGDELNNGVADNVIEFSTYEDYLDSQITPIDLFYLEVRVRVRDAKKESRTKNWLVS